MRLVLPPSDNSGAVEITQTAMIDLPIDVKAWHERVTQTDIRDKDLLVREVRSTKTNSGWPVALVQSDVMSEHGAMIVCRLHGFYRLFDRACVVTVTGTDHDTVSEHRALLLAAEVDWATDELLAVSQLWGR